MKKKLLSLKDHLKKMEVIIEKRLKLAINKKKKMAKIDDKKSNKSL